MLPRLTITKPGNRGRNAKSREFSVALVGYLAADDLWASGSTDSVARPVWLTYLGTRSAVQAFTANFRGGATPAGLERGLSLQVLKGAPHLWRTHKVPGGLLVNAYHPELFHLDATDASPGEIRFILAPPLWWLDEAARAFAGLGADGREMARASLMAAYFDRRTPYPILSDPKFHLRLYRAALEESWTRKIEETSVVLSSDTVHGRGFALCGLDSPVAVSIPAASFLSFLRNQIRTYHEEVLRHGQTRLAADRRLLPYPSSPLEQLCLPLEVA